MPELPEVEAVTRDLNTRIAGRSIEHAELRRDRLAPDITRELFREKLSDSTINFVHRRGKHILIDLDNGSTLIVHLRMSGRFMLLEPDDHDPKFTHAAFHFTDGTRLVFDDQRHFGLMKVAATSELAGTKELAKLAPEPFSDAFTPQYLSEKIRTSGRVLKEILLDQTKVCGVGNIYASEALYLSRINPKKRGKSISTARCSILYENIKIVLNEAIGLTTSLEMHPKFIGEGAYGIGSEKRWRIYDRENEPCGSCGTPIHKIRQGGRSTYYCPKCQR
jgi:formamidopyrimidine-DNA glycosylase